MREEWIKALYHNGFNPVKGTDCSVWECTFITGIGTPNIVARMQWTPKSCTGSDDEWSLEYIFAGTGHTVKATVFNKFANCMRFVTSGPMDMPCVKAYIEGYCAGMGCQWTPLYRRPEPVEVQDRDANRCVWDIAKERLLSEGWKDAGTPNLEYTSTYCGLGYTIRATMQDDGKFSVCIWGDPGDAQVFNNMTLDDVSAMAKKTLYALMPKYVEECAGQLRKAVSAKKCVDEYFSGDMRCYILPPVVPDEWLDKLHEKGFTIGSAKVTAYKNVNMLNGKAYKVSVTLMGSVVHVEIADAYQATPIVNFGVNSDSLDSALTKATEWLLEQSREA